MRRHALLVFPVLGLLSVASTALADEGDLTEKQLGSTDAPYGYVEYLPPGYAASPDTKHPIVVFLHGVGEEGNGTSQLFDAVTKHGPQKLIKNGDTYFAEHGVIVVAPQSPDWWNAGTMHTFFDYLVATYRVDPRRVYLTGLSMGGGGTWDYAHNHGDKLAAILPIAGASGPSDGDKFVGLPVWAFHDWDDGTVTRTNSIGWVNNIATSIMGAQAPDVLGDYPHLNGDSGQPAADPMTAHFDGTAWSWVDAVDPPAGSPVSLTLYPDGGHDAWTKTYDNVAVWDWFMAQTKAAPAGLGDGAIIVDNLDAGATFAGSWNRNEDEAGYYGWDEHRATAGAGVSATFAATLPAGSYDVKLSYTAGADHATIPVEIVHGGTSTTIDVDMKTGGGSFGSLGVFDFDGSAQVILHADSATGTVVADAVAFDPKTDEPTSSSSSTGGATSGSGAGAGPSTSAGAGGGSSGGDGDDDNSIEGHACSVGQGDGTSSPWGWTALAVGLVTWSARARRSKR